MVPRNTIGTMIYVLYNKYIVFITIAPTYSK